MAYVNLEFIIRLNVLVLKGITIITCLNASIQCVRTRAVMPHAYNPSTPEQM